MNRRQKIIVSVTTVFLVLLLLVGLTYAYFLTRITGNDKEKSISVTTANLAIEYQDGNGILEIGESLEPGDTVKFKDKDGNIVESKTFSVENKGNSTVDYVVVIDNVSVKYASTITIGNTTYNEGDTAKFESNDFVYTLTCTSGCNSVDKEIMFPIEGGILVGNSISVGETQNYELKMAYRETGVDQSNDMNKTLTARVNIMDSNDTAINPYSENKDSLAYNIINNSLILTTEEKALGYASYVTRPFTKIVEENSEVDESVLSVTNDDYGVSYYYRGNVKNNYVDFAGMCWRIVRIQGNGTVKLLLEDRDNTCAEANSNWNIPRNEAETAFLGNFGYTSFTSSGGARVVKIDYFSGNLADAYKIFQTKNLNGYTNYLIAGDYCFDDNGYATKTDGLLTDEEKQEKFDTLTKFWYGTYRRLDEDALRQPSLKCDVATLNDWGDNTLTDSTMYVGGLTADEAAFAGSASYTGNTGTTNYLNTGFENVSGTTLHKQYYYFLISPLVYYNASTSGASTVATLNADGTIAGQSVEPTYGTYRPVVVLKEETLLKLTNGTYGDGTKTNPYVVS